jgi:hypothetical protein
MRFNWLSERGWAGHLEPAPRRIALDWRCLSLCGRFYVG